MIRKLPNYWENFPERESGEEPVGQEGEGQAGC